jgi:hypothetical protein
VSSLIIRKREELILDGFWLLGNLGMGWCWLMEWPLSAANTSTLWQGLFTCFKGCLPLSILPSAETSRL